MPNLELGAVDIGYLVPLNIFSRMESCKSTKPQVQECSHFGYLINDGHNHYQATDSQRVACSRCGKRFGTSINGLNLYEYQYKIRIILYELFFEGCKQSRMSKRWGIPQSKLSEFKQIYVETVFKQHPRLINFQPYDLPKGVIYGDETYLGKMGNSNTQVVFCNDNFEILSTGPVETGNRDHSIIKTFFRIPQESREKLRVLVSDGEPTYKTVATLNSHRVILIQQYHVKSKLGQITIHKYKQFGPHLLHYEFHSHWKMFTKGKHELGFIWEIKFIKGKLPMGRGGPTKEMKQSKLYKVWRQKKDEYYSPAFQKRGSAKLFINPETAKVSLRKGSKVWMQRMVEQILPIFRDKCITNNRVESKHSQIKRTGKLRKQKNPDYLDKLFQLQEYIVQMGHLPVISFTRRPLYKYLIGHSRKSPIPFQYTNNGKKLTQTVLNGYV